MNFPDFFEKAPVVRMRDPLAQFLGAAEDGFIEYHYADAVRLAGHSCPTVAGAFLTGRAALAALYPEELPERGAITVHMPAPRDHGVDGVMAQVLTLLTGATGDGGFKGIGGRFARNGLLSFAENVLEDGGVLFERVDNGAKVVSSFNVDAVPPPADMKSIMMAVMQGQADTEQQAAFGKAWQERVRRMLVEHADDPALIHVRRPGE